MEMLKRFDVWRFVWGKYIGPSMISIMMNEYVQGEVFGATKIVMIHRNQTMVMRYVKVL